MRNLWLVAKNEYLRTVGRRAFVAVTLGVPVFIALMIGAVAFVAQMGDRDEPVGYVDQAGILPLEHAPRRPKLLLCARKGVGARLARELREPRARRARGPAPQGVSRIIRAVDPSAVSVIATVYDEAASIGALLESLAAQSRPPDEVVIVDGGSTQVAHGETAEETGAMLGMNAHALGIRHDLILGEGNRFMRDVKAGIDAAMKEFGAIHICCNFAGTGNAIRTMGKNGPFPLAEFNKIIQINLVGTFNVLRLCAEKMADNAVLNDDGGRGVIINISSIHAYEGYTEHSVYAGTRGAIVAFTRQLAIELAPRGVASPAAELVHGRAVRLGTRIGTFGKPA